MIDFKKADFIKSCIGASDRPEKRQPEAIMIGRSNVGKSMLINLLTSHTNLARVSSHPGKTTLLNFFDIDKKFYLVDAPGYGYSSFGNRDKEQFGKMMESYFSQSEELKVVVWLLDSRHAPSNEDLDFYQFLESSKLPHLIVFTKTDLLRQKDKAALTKNIQTLGWDIKSIILVSMNDRPSIENLRRSIAFFVS